MKRGGSVRDLRRAVPRVLVVTQIFPNPAEPEYAPYNRQQFSALAERCEVEVLATIPWFPGAAALREWSRAGRLVDVPDAEQVGGMSVRHPRFFFFPRVPSLLGSFYAASLAPVALGYRGRVDVVLGSYAYPDGFAAIAIAHLLGVPAVVKLHGGDIDVTAAAEGPRRMLRFALPHAAAVVAVSESLVEGATSLGVPRERVHVIPNGVDGAVFHPGDRAAARAALGVRAGAKLLLYVGRLERDKGVLDLIAAFARLRRDRSDLALAMVGDGAAAAECRAAAAELGDAVTFLGPRSLVEVAQWMTACDALTLPSWHEGTPNVLLEALACGRRVVATRVGGIPAVVGSPVLGELVEPRCPDELAAALLRVADEPYDPATVAALGGRGDWSKSADRLAAVLTRVCSERGHLTAQLSS